MINLNYRSSKPIYEQIKDGIISLAVSGAMQADDKLPSVRELSTQLAINPNTIQRAYRELEAAGYIYSVPGKGSFIAESNAADKMIAALLEKFDKTVEELKNLNVSSQELIQRIKGGEQNDKG